MTNTTTQNRQILVIGSNGKTGRRVLQRLNDRGVPATGATFSGNPKFDWNDAATWDNVLNDITAVYISYYPDLAIPGAVKSIELFTKLAVKKSVQKLVLLSGRGEEEAQQCEKVVMGAGVDFTIVQASWFCQNFSEGNFLEPILAGHVALPAGNIGEPFVDADDIADVAVAALTEEGHSNKLYEVTGPRLLTFKDAIAEIAKATGRTINYEQVSIEEYAAVLADYGLPKEVIWLVTYLFTEVLDGRNQFVADGVEQALGRKATDFSDYVKKAAATGVWG
ncbi:NmrA family transcriptional regulator [Niastella populi]|uniref:NmrA family transcriptional regulator n=1 Tax=Niastella populi TaxID=550983 RepID=A0A1V9FD13_9BACT|nr:NmrA family transcriptional regulator [Niastella populi]OQP56157.1 NmrA family transcriptional regulator [Niastella populi]